jgi:UDP-glucose 4-epimerase
MKIFVTGGAGFIGSHVVKLLIDKGHIVTVFDNLASGHQDQIDGNAIFVKGDLLDQISLEKTLQGHEAVIHMASRIEVGESVRKPVEFAENNIVGTIKL